MLGSFHGFLIQRDTLKKLPASLLVPGCMPLVVYLYLLLLIATQLLHGKASCAFVSVHIGMFRSANIGYLCQFSHGFHGASLNAHVNSSYNSRHAQMRFSVLLGITHWICCVPLFFFFLPTFGFFFLAGWPWSVSEQRNFTLFLWWSLSECTLPLLQFIVAVHVHVDVCTYHLSTVPPQNWAQTKKIVLAFQGADDR